MQGPRSRIFQLKFSSRDTAEAFGKRELVQFGFFRWHSCDKVLERWGLISDLPGIIRYAGVFGKLAGFPG